MTRCDKCKYGRQLWDSDTDEYFMICEATGEYIPDPVAFDSDLECDLFVNNLDDDY